WNLSYNNLLAVTTEFLSICSSTNSDFTTSGCISLAYTFISVDDATCREIGCRNEFHQSMNGNLWIIEKCGDRIDRLIHIVRWHIRSHTHSNTRRTVDE